jgi:hypothetical protein
MPAGILVVDDENTITCALELLLCEHDYVVVDRRLREEALGVYYHWGL